METPISKIICPVCSVLGEHVYTVHGFDMARCPSCALLFVEKPPISTEAIYDEGYFAGGNEYGGYMNYDSDKEVMRGTLEKCLDLLSSGESKEKLLDVGAATGYFVSLATEKDWDAEGMDVSEAAARMGREKGRKVVAGTFETLSYPEHSFDAITFFDVLEHVSNPRRLIDQVAHVLKPGGVVMLSTPDTGSFYAQLMGKRWHLLCPPEHLVLFNQKNVRLLLEEKGFEVLWMGRMPKRFTLPYIFQTAGRWLGISFFTRFGTWLLRTPFAKVSLPLDLRDNVFALARKKSA